MKRGHLRGTSSNSSAALSYGTGCHVTEFKPLYADDQLRALAYRIQNRCPRLPSVLRKCLYYSYGKWLKMKLPIRFFVFGLAEVFAFASCN
jgi:hypothetical protein